MPRCLSAARTYTRECRALQLGLLRRLRRIPLLLQALLPPAPAAPQGDRPPPVPPGVCGATTCTASQASSSASAPTSLTTRAPAALLGTALDHFHLLPSMRELVIGLYNKVLVRFHALFLGSPPAAPSMTLAMLSLEATFIPLYLLVVKLGGSPSMAALSMIFCPAPLLPPLVVHRVFIKSRCSLLLLQCFMVLLLYRLPWSLQNYANLPPRVATYVTYFYPIPVDVRRLT
ncbi:unnamed protein product [Prorocentrum cordatum]|uniref:Derlin n=1 Tax=Prorocentrum cordatum TaxID=2364126 RepID=A0ABN9W9P8_9DINO|nr:unnamed protein product [Polarella glacialis]